MALLLAREDGTTYHVITHQGDVHIPPSCWITVSSWANQGAREDAPADPVVQASTRTGVAEGATRAEAYDWLKAQPDWTGATDA